MGADTDKPDRLASGETLASVHSAGFPELLRQLGISLLVSTFQAGKLVVLRADGDSVNTHFLDFNTPMGVAADANRIALGTRSEIVEFHNMPAMATDQTSTDKSTCTTRASRKKSATGNSFCHGEAR